MAKVIIGQSDERISVTLKFSLIIHGIKLP